jgi:hypothetical protein
VSTQPCSKELSLDQPQPFFTTHSQPCRSWHFSSSCYMQRSLPLYHTAIITTTTTTVIIIIIT